MPDIVIEFTTPQYWHRQDLLQQLNRVGRRLFRYLHEYKQADATVQAMLDQYIAVDNKTFELLGQELEALWPTT